MALNKIKWSTLIIAIFFAILQVLQPFIHAHLDADHPIQELGFHVGTDHEESLPVSNTHTTLVAPHASHIVSVTSAIKQDIDPVLLVDVMGFALLVLCSVIVLQLVTVHFPKLVIISPQLSNRRLPASRAPPQF